MVLSLVLSCAAVVFCSIVDYAVRCIILCWCVVRVVVVNRYVVVVLCCRMCRCCCCWWWLCCLRWYCW